MTSSFDDSQYPGDSFPAQGDLISKYNRNYISVDPSFPGGPPTWRVSNPDEIPGGGSSGGGTDPNAIDTIVGVAPIDVTIISSKSREISMDIQQLDDRKT